MEKCRFLTKSGFISVLEILRLPKEVTLLDLKSLLQEHSLGFLPFKHKQHCTIVLGMMKTFIMCHITHAVHL